MGRRCKMNHSELSGTSVLLWLAPLAAPCARCAVCVHMSDDCVLCSAVLMSRVDARALLNCARGLQLAICTCLAGLPKLCSVCLALSHVISDARALPDRNHTCVVESPHRLRADGSSASGECYARDARQSVRRESAAVECHEDTSTCSDNHFRFAGERPWSQPVTALRP